jgi:hypothetical protein
MPFEAVVKMLNLFADQLEEVSIERDAYASILRRAGYSAEDVKHIADDAKSDPETRSRTRLALADLRERLVKSGVSSLSQELSGNLPPPEKEN